VGELIGVETGDLLAVADETCAACCASFPPTTRMVNPAVASVLHRAASQLLASAGRSPLDEARAAEARALADRSLTLCLPATLRVTPARGARPCAWRGAPVVADDRPEGNTAEFICEHSDHDRASDARCRICPDWALRRPISRRLALAELVPAQEQRWGKGVSRWAVGVTTAPRRQPTLEACLDSVVRAGWDSPRLFLDGTLRVPPRYAHLPTSWREEGIGAWPAWYLALVELLVQCPDADAFLMLQDDAILHDQCPLRNYLEQVLWPGDRPEMISLFYAGDDTTPGWHRTEGDASWSALALLFPPVLARQLVADPGAAQALLRATAAHHVPIPNVVFEWTNRCGIHAWYTVPSLAQHIGSSSTIWENVGLTLGRRAPWFSGDLDEPFALEGNLADFPEGMFPCGPADQHAYRRRVELGRERMRELTVVFCGLCRDVRLFLPRLVARLECLGSMFRDYRVVLFENDSKDATREFLADWQTVNPRVEVLGGTMGVARFPQQRSAARGEWLAACRNQYREHVAAAYAGFDHAIVIDTDLAGGWSYEGVADTFGADDWDAVGSNGLVRQSSSRPGRMKFRHYDVWAFRPAVGTKARCLVDHTALDLPRGAPLLPVESCFGGLAVYRMSCLLAAAYGGGDCEHVVFHDRLRCAGLGRQFLNPSQIVLYSPS